MTKYLMGLGITAILFLFSSGAHAVLITTSVGEFDITTVSGTFSSLAGQLDDQVWWGSEVLALEFATAVGGGLGFPNAGGIGPFFAYEDLGGGNSRVCVDPDGTPECGGGVGPVASTWAIGRAVASVPEPSTLGLLGAGLLGAGFLRRKRPA